MTPRQRFGVWVVAVVAALAAPLWLHTGVPRPAVSAAACGILGLTAIMLLLATTPHDAIRLPLHGSIATIGAGTALLPALAGASTWTVIGLGVAGLLLAALSLSGSLPRWLVLGSNFPWAWTLLIWHPSLWLMPRFRLSEGLDSDILLFFSPLAACHTVSAIMETATGARRQRGGWYILGSWVAAAVLVLISSWRFGG